MTSASDFSRDDQLFGADVGEDSLHPGAAAGDLVLDAERYNGPPVEQFLWWGDDPLDEALSPSNGVDRLFVELDGAPRADLVFGGGAMASGLADREATVFGHFDEQSELNHFGELGADGELPEADPIEFRFLEYALLDLVDGGDADAILEQDEPLRGAASGAASVPGRSDH